MYALATMTTYFAFSDESGQYRDNPGSKFCTKYPYYVRSVVLLDVGSWRELKRQFFELKDQYSLPADKEVKWSYVWTLMKHRENNEEIPKNKPYYFLRDIPNDTLLTFISNSCKLMGDCDYCKVILTVTSNDSSNSVNKESLYRMHLQDLMQRVEMEMQINPDRLAIFFFDSTDKDVDELIRNAYREIYLGGDFIKEYKHIKDSISFELSHHSFGIQMSDYAAGIFYGFLRGFHASEELFGEQIYKLVRRDDNSGNVLGWGIIEIPKNENTRSFLKGKLSVM